MNKEEAIKVLNDLLMEIYSGDENPMIGVRRTRAIQIAVDIAEKDKRIKCKDCKYFGVMTATDDDDSYFCGRLEYTSCRPDDYCSWAEEGKHEPSHSKVRRFVNE